MKKKIITLPPKKECINDSKKLEPDNSMSDKLIIPNIDVENVIKLHFTIKNKKQKDLALILTDNDNETNLRNTKQLCFFDSKKIKVKAWPVMIDVTQNGPLPLHTNKPCRNCHHTYTTPPLGCPIKYFPNEVNKSDKSSKYIAIVKFLKENNFPADNTEHFETEKMFCRYPCIVSYTLERLSRKIDSEKYRDSLTYLMLMYKKIHGISGIPQTIPAADEIDILEAYGGHLSIEKFRETPGILVYDETVNLRRPLMYSCSTYFEETKIY